MIESPRGAIDYDERGDGPTIVLVPGSCSTGAAWRPVIAQWGNRFRTVTTSLLGYGLTAERRAGGDADISHEAEILSRSSAAPPARCISSLIPSADWSPLRSRSGTGCNC